MVRLITQNLLSCPSKLCSYPANFPLSFRNIEKIQQVEAEFNEEFLRGFIVRLEWDALRKSAGEVSPALVLGVGALKLGEAKDDVVQPACIHLSFTRDREFELQKDMQGHPLRCAALDLTRTPY